MTNKVARATVKNPAPVRLPEGNSLLVYTIYAVLLVATLVGIAVPVVGSTVVGIILSTLLLFELRKQFVRE